MGQPQQGFGQPPVQQQFQQQPQFQQPQQGAQPGYGAPPQQAGYAAPASMPSMGGMPGASKGFLSAFLDFKFENLVLPRVAKVLYGLFLLLSVITFIGMFFMGFYAGFIADYNDVGQGIMMILMSPIVAFIYLIAGRLLCEQLIISFKSVEYLREISEKSGNS